MRIAILEAVPRMSKFTAGWQKASVLEEIFDQLSDALILYDPEFHITGVNRAAEKLFGMSSDEMLGKRCQEVFRCSVCEPNCGMVGSALIVTLRAIEAGEEFCFDYAMSDTNVEAVRESYETPGALFATWGDRMAPNIEFDFTAVYPDRPVMRGIEELRRFREQGPWAELSFEPERFVHATCRHKKRRWRS